MEFNRFAEFFDTPETSDIDHTEIGEAQWKLLSATYAKYQGKIVKGTHCKFEEDSWFTLQESEGKARNQGKAVHWSRLFGDQRRALELVCRVAVFEYINTSNGKAGSLILGLVKPLSIMAETLISMQVLCGGYNDVLVGLSALEDKELSIVFDRIIGSTQRETQAAILLGYFSILLAYTNAQSASLPFCKINYTLPWDRAGLTKTKWVKQRAHDLAILFTPIQGFEPIHHDSVNLILNESINIIENESKAIEKLADLCRKHYDLLVIHTMHYVQLPKHNLAGLKRRTVNSLTEEEISDLKKMYRLFKKLERLIGEGQSGDNIFERLEKNIKWFEKDLTAYRLAAQSIFNKAKTASAFIIFFTSGLRVSDVANLKQDSCKPSRVVTQMFNIDIELQKTSNAIHIPVPQRTKNAMDFAAKLKMTSSPYIFDWLEILPPLREPDRITEHSLNALLRKFTDFFNIPFDKTIGEGSHSAHDIRVTVAGWMGSASNFAIILVRRLFGHSNDVMPSTYLNNNPFFTKQKEDLATESAIVIALAMAKGAKEGRLAGKKGEQLEAGFKEFEKKNKDDFDKKKSASLSDIEIMDTFSDILYRRMMNGSLCGFITPMGVACGRNPINPEPAPCGIEAYKMYMEKWDIDPSVLKTLTLMDPKNCIGGGCKEAIIGPWSQAILESLKYYQGYIQGLYPEIGDKEFKAHAEAFIAQYTEPMKKVYGEEVVRIIGEEEHA